MSIPVDAFVDHDGFLCVYQYRDGIRHVVRIPPDQVDEVRAKLEQARENARKSSS